MGGEVAFPPSVHINVTNLIPSNLRKISSKIVYISEISVILTNVDNTLESQRVKYCRLFVNMKSEVFITYQKSKTILMLLYLPGGSAESGRGSSNQKPVLYLAP